MLVSCFEKNSLSTSPWKPACSTLACLQCSPSAVHAGERHLAAKCWEKEQVLGALEAGSALVPRKEFQEFCFHDMRNPRPPALRHRAGACYKRERRELCLPTVAPCSCRLLAAKGNGLLPWLPGSEENDLVLKILMCPAFFIESESQNH